MEDIERLITEYYCDMEKKCSLSESKMDDFFKQTTYQRHTKVWAKIKRMQFGLIICIILFIPLTSYATGKAVGVLKEKVQDTNLSNDDINELYVYLKDNGYTDQQIKELQELHTNDRGQTYGAEAFLPDLVVVISDQGEVGYVYAKELDEIPGGNVNSPSEAAEYMKNRDKYLPYVIDVYDSDGETEIGTFTIQE